MAKFEMLAKELETILNNSDEELKNKGLNRAQIETAADHASDDSYSQDKLVEELREAKLGYFANKIINGLYNLEVKNE